MNENLINVLVNELHPISASQIKKTLELLNEGNTIPFIARYRKEVTGSLDEVSIKDIQDRYEYLTNLKTRKEEVIRLIDEQGKLSDDLKDSILAATKLNQVEDLYRPYRQKRRTKATIAKEKGLEPLALYIMNLPMEGNVEDEARNYLGEEVISVEDALLGAHEIMAEVIGDEPKFRTWIRNHMFRQATLVSTVKNKDKDEKGVFEMYYAFKESAPKLVSHRILAMNRGEKEDILKIDIDLDDEPVFNYLNKELVGKKAQSMAAPYVINAYEDAYKRFIKPALERELRNELNDKAEAQAIHIFGENLRNLLLAAPLKGKVVMGFDPAYRTGCKLAIVDATGKVLNVDVIYPHAPATKERQERAAHIFLNLIKKYKVEMVVIGNGTASRESEIFVADALKTLDHTVYYLIANEAGASVYSASEIARKEFPHLEVEQRSAVSIARRVQDPLAELVKIDPKSVGVGQYQHDVTQKLLEEQLGFVVETAVNQVGVNLNTASPQLLERVAGLSKAIAQNIVTYREENGIFTSRNALKKVPRLGPKAFEQAAGFIRIPEAKNILDNTGIHPESYDVAKQIIKDLNIDVKHLGSNEMIVLLQHAKIKAEDYGIGQETFADIMENLVKPGRDFREALNTPLLRTDVLTMEDLKEGMELQGTVRNVVDFGAFVDIGVKQDGLVHISKLSKAFVKHPTDVVAIGDIVKVWILNVDLKKQRIQLTMIQE